MFGHFVIEGQRSKRYKLGEKWELNGEEIRKVIDELPTVIPAEESDMDSFIRIFEEDEEDGMDSFIRILKD